MSRLKKITIDALDPDSIRRGLDMLAVYERRERNALTDLMEELCKDAKETANAVYGSDVYVSFALSSGFPPKAVVFADGEEVCFIEFGAGVYAAPENGFAPEASKIGVTVYPGSWSETHERTFQNWEAKGRPGEYAYNKVPRAGLYAAYQTIIGALETRAKQVFS